MNATVTVAGMYDHLLDLTDDVGTFEHADHAVPRRDHGYCVDDVARGLLIACREPQPTARRLRTRPSTDCAVVRKRNEVRARSRRS